MARYIGTSGDDRFEGTGYAWDYADGGDGNDVMHGNDGNDTLKGGKHHDRLYGGKGNDMLKGNGGNDWLVGGGGADIIEGGQGNDWTSYANGASGAQVYLDNSSENAGAAEGDIIRGVENIMGTAHDDVLVGNHLDNMFEGAGGGDIIVGNSGRDTASYSTSDAGVRVNLATGDASGGHATGDRLENIENLRGSGHDDHLTGDEGENHIHGGAGADNISTSYGNDAVWGGNGDDEIKTGDGNDIVSGGNGDDLIRGGKGTDVVYGGAGSDTASYSTSDAAVMVNLATGEAFGGHATGDRLEDIENLRGSAHHDTLYGDDADNILLGLNGNDIIHGGGGHDHIHGDFDDEDCYIPPILGGDPENQDDNPTICNIGGHTGEDEIHGGSGDDTIFGGRGNDMLYGDEGRDVLDGGLGNDRLEGGADADTYVWHLHGHGADTIVNYSSPEGDRFLIINNRPQEQNQEQGGAQAQADTQADILQDISASLSDTGDIHLSYNGQHMITLENPDLPAFTAQSSDDLFGIQFEFA